MTVIVQLFARAKDLARTERLAVEIRPGATVQDLRREIAVICPALAELLPKSALAVNDEFARDEQGVSDQDRVALLPPVSGG